MVGVKREGGKTDYPQPAVLHGTDPNCTVKMFWSVVVGSGGGSYRTIPFSFGFAHVFDIPGLENGRSPGQTN